MVCWGAIVPVTHEWLLDNVPEAEGLYCLLTDQIDQEVIGFARRLHVVSTMSVGYDHIDIEVCTSRNIPVGHTPGILTETTGRFGVCFIDGCSSPYCEGADYVRQGNGRNGAPESVAWPRY